MPLTRDNVQHFLQRRWSLARRTKDEAVGRWCRQRGATVAFRLAQALLDDAWPRLALEQRRRTDVSGLVQLTETLARAHAARR